jgi:hypothetical protein
MKRLLLSLLLSFVAVCSYSQEHISFNGATFGTTFSTFETALIGSSNHGNSRYIEHTYKDVYNRYFIYGGKLNSYECQYYIHCSRKSQIVFETICWFKVSNLKAELAPFVKLFEEKYGGHIKADASSLGSVAWRRSDHTFSWSVGNSYPINEMLALIYTIHRKSDNKAIGEIRISAAPDHSPTSDNDSGIIEITYRDYKASDMSINEYNSVMNSIF